MIKDLNARLERSEQARSNNWLLAGGGVLAGAALVILTVVAVGASN
jgi:Tfp pilus assembly protein PilN